MYRAVARKHSVWVLYVCAGGFDILKLDTNSTYLYCFIFQLGWIGDSFGGAKAPKPRVATGLIMWLSGSFPSFHARGQAKQSDSFHGRAKDKNSLQ